MDYSIGKNNMTSNVIKFPSKQTTETNTETMKIDQESLDFAYEFADILHHAIHEKSGTCIFTDELYIELGICLTEVISAIYLLSKGQEHPFQEIAKDLFGDDSIFVDIDTEIDYNETSEDIDEET